MITIKWFFARLKRFILRNPQAEAGERFEKTVEAGLNKIVEQNKHFWFRRYYDFRILAMINRSRGTHLPVPRMVADYEAVYQGQFYTIECKTAKQPRYSIAWVKEHQVETGLKLEKAGAIYWILICQRIEPIKTERLYALTPQQWLHLIKITKLEDYTNISLKQRAYLNKRQKGYKSISWENIRKHSIELFKMDGVWDLTPLFKGMN